MHFGLSILCSGGYTSSVGYQEPLLLLIFALMIFVGYRLIKTGRRVKHLNTELSTGSSYFSKQAIAERRARSRDPFPAYMGLDSQTDPGVITRSRAAVHFLIEPCQTCVDSGRNCRHAEDSWLARDGFVRIDSEPTAGAEFSIWQRGSTLVVLAARPLGRAVSLQLPAPVAAAASTPVEEQK